MRKLIFHIDVNSAYLSWEAARRVANGEPDLRLIPSAIGGDRDKRTGVILAKSIPAKKYKITTGEPVALALRKCPNLVLAKPDFKLYVQNSSNDFKNKSHQLKLHEPTDGTNEIYELAKKLVSELWNGKTPLRLLGIALTDLAKEDYAQTSLFAEADQKKERSKKLDQTVDALRSKYGRATIQRGALLQDTHEVGKKYRAQMEREDST